MAVDLIIGTLLLLSVLVNVLALYAFRVTPSLQTRSNSFVVNLLVINVISCLVLAVFLILNTHSVRDLLFATNAQYGGHSTTDDEKRFFALDSVVASLGALSLTLVIWDSHSAITDPLRYHSRLSTLKVGLMIATVWLVGITFGVVSYFWGLNNLAFKLVFCSVIVVAPFCLICTMYYRIFREARENGLRMRQNGSSPLLQSALNLVTGQLTAAAPRIETIMERSPSYAEGLTLNIDDSFPKVASSSSQIEFGTEAENNAHTSSMANLSGSRKQSLREMFLFGVVDGSTATSDADQSAIPMAECLLNKLNNLKLQRPEEMIQVRSTPDLQRYLNADDGLKDTTKADPEQNVLEFSYRSSVPPQTPPKHLGYMTSIRHRLSNASSLFKYREESRAARISILVVIMFLVSYIPFGMLVLIEGHTTLLSAYQQTALAIFFVVLATLSSPIIFAYRNKRVQRAIKRLLRLETKELLPSSFYSANAKRIQRQNNFSVYKKNLVLKSGAGRKMQKLMLACPGATEKPQSAIRSDVGATPRAAQNGYENYLEEEAAVSRKVSMGSSVVMDQKRHSTTSTTSTIRCEDVLGKQQQPASLLSRFGFIRRQSGNMQKYGVSV